MVKVRLAKNLQSATPQSVPHRRNETSSNQEIPAVKLQNALRSLDGDERVIKGGAILHVAQTLVQRVPCEVILTTDPTSARRTVFLSMHVTCCLFFFFTLTDAPKPRQTSSRSACGLIEG